MRVVSVNLGQLRTIEFEGRSFTTGIFKEPVQGQVEVTTTGLAGDQIGSPSVHGGEDQAIYTYSIEHYNRWQKFLGTPELPWGSLGENLTLHETPDATLHIGDTFRIGTAEVQLTIPRVPCATLAARYQRPDLVDAFQRYGKPGAYFRVLKEGLVHSGAWVEVMERHPAALPLTEVYALVFDETASKEQLERAASVEAMPQKWRDRFTARAAAL
jgi:MOSC domain-containing protein YiiM